MKLLRIALFILCFCRVSLSLADSAQAVACVKKLAVVCPYSDFEAALFRCSWRRTSSLPANCNELFTAAFQYMYYADRPISKHVCPPFKAPCADLQTDFEAADLKFNSFLKRKYMITAVNFISLTEAFNK